MMSLIPSNRTALLPCLLLCLLLSAFHPQQQYLQLLPGVNADKDANIYPWGSNPNTHFKMYWKDAANIIQDLDNFQALYVQVHGCVWSECGVDNFDDDGENHDGDEDWYITRTRQFCANTAFSLYGIRKNNFKLVNTCSKGTYINSFFTYGGADTLARALDLSVNTKDSNRYAAATDDTYGGTSNSDCVAVDGDGRRALEHESEATLDQFHRALSDSSSDEDDDWDDEEAVDTSNVASTTMGCAASATSKYNKFVVAGFEDDYCSGASFVETVNTLKSYNRALHKVSCTRIWDLGSYNRNQKNNGDDDAYAAADDDAANRRDLGEDDNYYKRTYNSVAERLLYHSWACDLSLYPNDCPDPYGLKRKYFNVMKAAANGQPITLAVMNAKLRKPIKVLTILFLITGCYLCCFAYWLRNRSYIVNHGGGVRGLWATVQRDIFAAHVAVQAKVQKARERHSEGRQQRREAEAGRDGKRRSGSSKKDRGLWAALFGSKSSKKKSSGKNGKKRRSGSKRGSSDRHLQRTPSGRSQGGGRDRDEWTDEDEASQYTEMSEDHKSQRSARSRQYTNANHSSTRTSKAAEAAFAAAAQFDLEQQAGGPGNGGDGGQPNSNSRHHHPSILPSSSSNLEGAGAPRSSRSRDRDRTQRPSSGKSRSRSHSQRRRQTNTGQVQGPPSSTRARGLEASPTRSPGGTSARRSHSRSGGGGGGGVGGGTSKSPERRVFV